jgi:hypothetical protein
MSQRRFMIRDNARGENDEIASDVGDEQAAESKKADGVRTAGGDAQQDQQNLDCEPIVDRWRRHQPHWAGGSLRWTVF